jgi:hypothetical protein
LTGFVRGQVWQYRTRPGEEASRLLINKIEVEDDLGEVFHISVRALRVRNPHAPGGFAGVLPHLPVSRATLEASVVALDGIAAPNPAFLQGYATWRVAYANGEAGIFSTPVAAIIDGIEATLAAPG